MSVLTAPSDVESMHPLDVLRWTFGNHGARSTVVTASFEDAVLAHLAWSADPSADIVLLDTQYLFAETWWLADQMSRRFGIGMRVVTPQPEVVADDRWQHDPEGCCAVRKVEPLQRVLQGASAWVTGVRRVDGPTRAAAPVVSFDLGRNVVKVNPLATWTDDDMALYVRLHDLPAHPLAERGYPSIGCWPCTRPVAAGEDRRAGRWAGQAKTECGLHG